MGKIKNKKLEFDKQTGIITVDGREKPFTKLNDNELEQFSSLWRKYQDEKRDRISNQG